MGNQQFGNIFEYNLGGNVIVKRHHTTYQKYKRKKINKVEGYSLDNLENEMFMQNLVINAQNRYKIRLGCYDPNVNGSYQNYIQYCESVYLLECIPEFIRNDVRLYQN